MKNKKLILTLYAIVFLLYGCRSNLVEVENSDIIVGGRISYKRD